MAATLATGARGQILLISTAGGEPRVLGEGVDVLVWAPDSHSMLTVAGRGNQAAVWRVPLEGQAHRVNLDARNIRGPMDLHPDGRRIALTRAPAEEAKPVEVWAIENFRTTLNPN